MKRWVYLVCPACFWGLLLLCQHVFTVLAVSLVCRWQWWWSGSCRGWGCWRDNGGGDDWWRDGMWHVTHGYPHVVPIPTCMGMGFTRVGCGWTRIYPWVTHDVHYIRNIVWPACKKRLQIWSGNKFFKKRRTFQAEKCDRYMDLLTKGTTIHAFYSQKTSCCSNNNRRIPWGFWKWSYTKAKGSESISLEVQFDSVNLPYIYRAIECPRLPTRWSWHFPKLLQLHL